VTPGYSCTGNNNTTIDHAKAIILIDSRYLSEYPLHRRHKAADNGNPKKRSKNMKPQDSLLLSQDDS
jgi:hypothetical protein